jgi:hypothetical protein
MSDDRGKDLQGHHNQGEKDAASGEHNPPHTYIPLWDDIVYGTDFVDKMNEDNEAYNEGWSNTHNQ